MTEKFRVRSPNTSNDNRNIRFYRMESLDIAVNEQVKFNYLYAGSQDEEDVRHKNWAITKYTLSYEQKVGNRWVPVTSQYTAPEGKYWRIVSIIWRGRDEALSTQNELSKEEAELDTLLEDISNI